MFLACAVPVSAQTTVQVDYKSSIEKASKAYDAKAWGECMKNLRVAVQAALKQRTDAIRAAMPAAPAGMKTEDEESSDVFLVGIGCQVARRYQTEDGEKNFRLQVQADYTMMPALLPMLTTPEIVRANKGEMLEYAGKHKAVLTKQGDDGKQWKLQIVVDNLHMVEIDAQGFDRAALLKVFDDAAVGKLAKELMN